MKLGRVCDNFNLFIARYTWWQGAAPLYHQYLGGQTGQLVASWHFSLPQPQEGPLLAGYPGKLYPAGAELLQLSQVHKTNKCTTLVRCTLLVQGSSNSTRYTKQISVLPWFVVPCWCRAKLLTGYTKQLSVLLH